VSVDAGTPARAAPRPRAASAPRVPWWRRHANLIVLGALAVAFLLPLRGLMRNQGPPMEEGFMLVFPERVLEGDLPNRDFLHLYGPGSLWVLAGLYKVFGVALEVQRLFALAQQIGVVAGVYLLARHWGRAMAGVCAAISLVIIVPPIGLTALAWVGGVALGLLGLVALLRAVREPGVAHAPRAALAGGVLAGLALLFRLDLVVAVGLSGLAVWLAAPRLRRRIAAGFGLGLSPYLVHLATAGPGNVFQGMVLDPVVYLRGGRRLPIPPPPDRFDGFLQRAGELRALDWPVPTLRSPAQLTVWFFLLLAAAATVVAAGWVLHRRWAPGAHRGLVLLAAGLFGVGMLPQALQRVDSTHFAWVSCVPVALLPVALLELLRRHRPAWPAARTKAVAAGVVVGLVVLVIPRYTLTQYTDYALQSFGIHRQAFEIERDGRRFYYGRPDVARQLGPLLEALGDLSEPGQSLLVGTSDLRFTPYSDAFLYYLFPELEPATYYIEMDPGVANDDDSGLADEVRAADFLILSSVWDDWDEPNDSRIPGSNEPNEVVDELFCEVGDFGGLYRLMARCELLGRAG
jgi:hypothetical protein